MLLVFFNLTAPIVIACFTGNMLMSIFASVVVVSGFSALWLVANELEDPFGFDANDMPMSKYHIEFCEALDSSLKKPWLVRDYWTVDEGPHELFKASKAAYSRGSLSVKPTGTTKL